MRPEAMSQWKFFRAPPAPRGHLGRLLERNAALRDVFAADPGLAAAALIVVARVVS